MAYDRFIAMPNTKTSLINDLRKLGVSEGDGLFVHSSMRAIGETDGGVNSVIRSLLEAVGEHGLLGMPGFSKDAYPPADIEYGQLSREEVSKIEFSVLGFDVERSPTVGMGVIAETFRQWPGTKRSGHPTTSVCLSGADADDLIAPHDAAWAMGSVSPFGRMRDRPNMKILLIGVGWNRCTPLHTAENYAEFRRRKIRRFKSGPGHALWFETPDVADDLNRLFPSVGVAFEETGRVQTGVFGGAHARLCRYDQLIRFAAGLISSGNHRSGAQH